MEGLRQYAVSVISITIICSILSSISSQGSKKGFLHLLSGIILIISVIGPIRRAELPDWDSFDFSCDAEAAVAAGQELSRDTMADIIKSTCEAYILDKAADLGAEITIRIYVDQDHIPYRAAIGGTVSPAVRQQLAAILEKDLGIAKENHAWTG